MKIPKWKHWTSYVWEQHIESAYSDYSKDLYVVLKRGHLQLCTSNAIYSFEDLYLNFSRAFQNLNLEKTEDLDVLVLGVGMGSIPMVMESQGFYNCHFTAIEIDPVVIELLTKYGLPKINSPIEVYETDAVTYVQITHQKFDVIAIDIFIDDVIPDAVQSIEFLKGVESCLAENGLVMMNHLSLKSSDKHKAKKFFDEVFKQVFPSADYIDVFGNWMLINDESRISR